MQRLYCLAYLGRLNPSNIAITSVSRGIITLYLLALSRFRALALTQKVIANSYNMYIYPKKSR